MNDNTPLPDEPRADFDASNDAGSPSASDPWAVIPEEHACWRCGKTVSMQLLNCPYCRAPQAGASPEGRRVTKQKREGLQPLVKVTLFYMAMLGISLAFGMYFLWQRLHDVPWQQQVQDTWHAILAAEVLDCLLIALALYGVGRPPKLPARRGSGRAVTWICCGPLLALCLALNFGYHQLLTDFLNLPEGVDALLAAQGLSLAVWIVYCLQPAIFEEVFFRYLALGTLRETNSVHAAVFLSAVMFGMAHVYAPLSIPYLTLVGVFLGYARVYSGGMLLPMILHFAHNAVVIYWETR